MSATTRGCITLASSDEDGASPDVGVSLGLGCGRSLWIGEISKALHAEGGSEVASVGADGGQWIVLLDETQPQGMRETIIGKAAGQHVGLELCNTLRTSMMTGPHLVYSEASPSSKLLETGRQWLAEAFAGFVNDPPDCERHEGYLGALYVVAVELFGMDPGPEFSPPEPAKRPTHLRLVPSLPPGILPGGSQ